MKKETFSSNWKLLSFSKKGKRNNNEDRIGYFDDWSATKGPICVFIACDGVGGTSGGAECAEEVVQAVYTKLQELISIYGLSIFKDSGSALLVSELTSLKVKSNISGATTLVALIFGVARLRNGYHCTAIWAGDSRAHIIDSKGQYLMLTKDHHDEEGRLTAAYVANGDGYCHGSLEIRHTVIPYYPLAFGVTTDGVHGKCVDVELCAFLAWCILQKGIDSDTFALATERFLAGNLSDNLSAIFLFRLVALPNQALMNILEQWSAGEYV